MKDKSHAEIFEKKPRYKIDAPTVPIYPGNPEYDKAELTWKFVYEKGQLDSITVGDKKI